MIDTLPNRPRSVESAVVNLDTCENDGTHWVCFKKRRNAVNYFDSYGDLQPPRPLIRYFGGGSKIKYNYKNFQKNNRYNCGHLCLKFLTSNTT